MPEIRLKEGILKHKGLWRKSAIPIVFRLGNTYWVDDDCFDPKRMVRFDEPKPVVKQAPSATETVTEAPSFINSEPVQTLAEIPSFIAAPVDLVDNTKPKPAEVERILAGVAEMEEEAKRYVPVGDADPLVLPNPVTIKPLSVQPEELVSESKPEIDTKPYIPLGIQESAPTECPERRKHASIARSGRTCSACGYTKESKPNAFEANEEERSDGDLQGRPSSESP